MREDKRPEPKPRKHPQLWQSYKWWDELMGMRRRHLLRISSIERGKSNMDVRIEHDMMEHMKLDENLAYAKREMVRWGKTLGPIWEWGISIRGLAAGGILAQLLARIDDIGKFSMPSKLIRFCGYAVVDGKAERCQKGQTAPYSKLLKSICYLVGDQFIKQQTSPYADIYYEDKARLRRLYPEKVEASDSPWPYNYTDSHIHRMARRKMIKIFLQHLWLKWREFEGLPVTEPYVQGVMGHTHIVPPP